MLCTSVFGQRQNSSVKPISQNDSYSRYVTTVNNLITNILEPIDFDSVLNDDKEIPNLPQRFGVGVKVNYNLDNSGIWDTLPNGDRLWRLKVVSPGAYQLNFSLNKFVLSDSSLFFIYNPDMNSLLGAYTKKNNRKDSTIDFEFIKGDTAIFEFYETQTERNESLIEISGIVHGIVDLMGTQKTKKSISDANECTIDVNCPEGDDWCREKRAVTSTLVKKGSNTYYEFHVSGCLLNNESNDLTKAYVLTAWHGLKSFFPNVNTKFRFSHFNDECNGNLKSQVFSFYGGSVLSSCDQYN